MLFLSVDYLVGKGVVNADRIAVHFSPESNVLWKTVTPEGHSSPVIWDNRIFLTRIESDFCPDFFRKRHPQV